MAVDDVIVGKKNFGVRPVFARVGGVNMLVDKAESGNRVPSLYCRKQAPDLPSWIMFDKNILKFQAYFQQSLLEVKSASSILRKVDIIFFLEDGTIKIVNCDNFTRVFLNRLGINRAPSPKKPPKHRPFRQFLDLDRQVLRFYGYWDDRESESGIMHNMELHYFLGDDSIEKIPPMIEMSGGPKQASYTPADLTIGAVVNLYGRKVVLTDCDPFTKEYYRATFGFGKRLGSRRLPPWNGYGSYEDSAENCRTVLPKAPHRDFIKVGFDSHILRFAARLITDIPEDASRYFIVKYSLCDDTIEPPAYTDKDMWVGNELVVNKHRFRLVGADEYALRYLEVNSNEYPMANIALILDKIRRTLATQDNGYKNFVAKYMVAVLPDKKELMQALKEIMCDKMTEHEFLTITRFFRGDPGKEKSLWDERARLHEGVMHADEAGSGVLPVERVRQLLRAHRLPINTDLMDCMLQCEDLMSFLDFRTRPVENLTDADYLKVVRHAPTVKDTE
ncbi:EF-hand domain-containing family member C2, partial [Operophtera brumata]